MFRSWGLAGLKGLEEPSSRKQGGDGFICKVPVTLVHSVWGTAAGHCDCSLGKESGFSGDHRCPPGCSVRPAFLSGGPAEGLGRDQRRWMAGVWAAHSRRQAGPHVPRGQPGTQPHPPNTALEAVAPYHLFTNSWKSWVKTPLGSLGGGCGREETGGSQMLTMVLE